MWSRANDIRGANKSITGLSQSTGAAWGAFIYQARWTIRNSINSHSSLYLDEQMKVSIKIEKYFALWMVGGGHVMGRNLDAFTFRRGLKVARINNNRTMNKYAEERYLMFLNQWMDKGKVFIQQLNEQMPSL